jgi:hypothetical protein
MSTFQNLSLTVDADILKPVMPVTATSQRIQFTVTDYVTGFVITVKITEI